MLDFFASAQKRRSIRKFTDETVPDEVMQKAFEAAIIAPNSSNVQTWDFYWVSSPDKKSKLVEACLSQSAARTAKELVVVVADPKLWKRSRKPLIDYIHSLPKIPSMVTKYYESHTAIVYTPGPFNIFAPFKWLASTAYGIFKPTLRGPYSKNDLQIVSIKSAALAAENFVLAISAQGFASCMMEGFDEVRVRRLLNLGCSARVVMVIGVGREGERGTWGPRFRLDSSQVVHRI